MAEPKNIVLGIGTPQGPFYLCLSIEELSSFVEKLNGILDSVKGKASIPKVFEDAFKEEE